MANEKKNEQIIAMEMYMSGKYTQKQIAEFVDVEESTITRWVDRYQWEELRNADNITSKMVVKNLYVNIKEIQEAAKSDGRPLSTKETDQIVKLSKTIDNLSKGPTLHAVVDVMKQLSTYCLQQQPDLVPALTDLQKSFLRSLTANG
jgi:hypothetical protein